MRYFQQENVIICGDLNFTMPAREILGSYAKMDPLSVFFNNFLVFQILVAVEPPPFDPLGLMVDHGTRE